MDVSGLAVVAVGFSVFALLVVLAASSPAPAADPVLAAAGDIACAPESADFGGGLGTPTACRMKPMALRDRAS